MLKQQITDDMKAAMRGGDKERLRVIRMMMAAIKQREVDERKEPGDAEVLAIIEKMVKQRRESIAQFEKGNRPELAAAEQQEIDVLGTYLPDIKLDGTLVVAHRLDSFLKKYLNIPGELTGEIINRQNIGLTIAQIVAMWHDEHPNEQILISPS